MVNSPALALDHLVINTHFEIDAARLLFEQFGFQLTPRGHHSLGSVNHLLMFEDDYLELIGLPKDSPRLRREILESSLGIDGLVFKSDDAARTQANLRALGYAVQDIQAFSRAVELDGDSVDARFETVRFVPGQFSAGRLYYCKHFTPELVWRKEWQTHPNGVTQIAALLIVDDEPLQAAKQYCAVMGGSLKMGAQGEYRVYGSRYVLVFTTPLQYVHCYGALACAKAERQSFFGAIALKTASLEPLRKTLGALKKKSVKSTIHWREWSDRITVHIPSLNALLDFVETDIF